MHLRPWAVVLALAPLAVAASSQSALAQFAAPAGGAPVAAAPSTNPAVIALLSTNPQTPRDVFEVVRLLLNLNEPASAKPLLLKLAESAATDEQVLLEIGRRFDRAMLEQVASAKDLQPESRQLVDGIYTAQRKQARDPARIAELIARLQDPSYEVQVSTLLELKKGHEESAKLLIDALLDPARANEHAMVRIALGALDSDAVAPLAAMTDSPDEAVRLSALQALGLIKNKQSRPALYRAAFSPRAGAAERQSAQASLKQLDGALPKPIEAAGQLYVDARSAYLKRFSGEAEPAVVWQWDAASKRPVILPVPARAAALDGAARLAGIAAEIAGNDQYALLLSRAASLELALSNAKPEAAEQRAAAQAWAADKKLSQADVESLLDFSVEHDRMPVAAEVVRMLASTPAAQALASPVPGKPSPLAKAAVAPDRGLRFAAVETILALRPTQPFVGSSAVGDELAYFAGSRGERKVLIVDFNPGRGRDLAGVLAAAGAIEVATSTQEAVRLLAADPDFDAVLMHRVMTLPEMGQLLMQARRSYRTARLTAIVYCEPEQVERTKTTLLTDPYATAMVQPRSMDDFIVQFRPLRESVVGVDPAVRLTQAQAAIVHIGELLKSNWRAWDVRRYEAALVKSAWNPAVGKQTAAALGLLGTATAQRTLVDVAAASLLPLDLRQAAASAFCDGVIRHGMLLTTTEVVRQYDRYNASETLDKPTQELLGAILDAIESRAAKIPLGPAGKLSADSARP